MLIIEIVKVFSVANMQMERCSLQDHGKKRTSNLSGSQPLRIGGVFFSFFLFMSGDQVWNTCPCHIFYYGFENRDGEGLRDKPMHSWA